MAFEVLAILLPAIIHTAWIRGRLSGGSVVSSDNQSRDDTPRRVVFFEVATQIRLTAITPLSRSGVAVRSLPVPLDELLQRRLVDLSLSIRSTLLGFELEGEYPSHQTEEWYTSQDRIDGV